MANLENFEIEPISNLDIFIDTYNYRNFSFPVYKTDDFFYTIISGKKYKVCLAIENYKTKIEKIIDFQLDLIYDFENGTYLIYFDNAGNRDAKLYYNNRLIKIFLLENLPQIPDDLIEQAKQILKTRPL